MFGNTLKIAWKVLGRRRFFTFVSLFGIAFTLAVLLVVAAIADYRLVPRGAEKPLRGALHLTQLRMAGEENEWVGGPGWRFLDQYTRDLPGIAQTTFFTNPGNVANYPDGEKVVSRLRSTDAEYWGVFAFRFLEGAPYTRDDVAAARQVVVVNDATRRRFFGAGPAVGRDFAIDGRAFRIVGVVETVPGDQQLAFADVWRPHTAIASAVWHDRLMGDCVGVFVPAPDASAAAVQADFQARLQRVEFDDPANYDLMAGRLESRLEMVARDVFWTPPGQSSVARVAFYLFGGAFLFMLLPAINLISINLSRIYERSSEIGVRKAFGATNADLVGQFLLENVVLCVLGSVLALAAAAGILELVETITPLAYADFRINWRLFLVAVALAVIFGVLSGAWPAYKMSRQHPVLALQGGSR
jgi:putative ABC transport system permease protein